MNDIDLVSEINEILIELLYCHDMEMIDADEFQIALESIIDIIKESRINE